jgi:hypothetical protein
MRKDMLYLDVWPNQLGLKKYTAASYPSNKMTSRTRNRFKCSLHCFLGFETIHNYATYYSLLHSKSLFLFLRHNFHNHHCRRNCDPITPS